MSEVFMLVVDLARKLGVTNIKSFPAPWVHRVDERWTIAVNGLPNAATCNPEGCMPVDLEPYHMAVWWNGWLAGLLTPTAGQLAAHPDGANEDRLCADLRAAIGRA